MQRTSWPFKPEKISKKQEVNLYGRAKIQTFIRTALSWQRKEAEGILQKQLPTPTTPTT